jgi:purine-binding chemotaxis protein CheW
MSNLALSRPSSPGGAEVASLHVVFKVAAAEYAVPAESVLQMESYGGATAVPGASPFVEGIAQVRGRVVPVVNLRSRFGLPRAEATLDSRMVVTQHGDRVVALLADSAREVVMLSPSQLVPPPPLVEGGANGFVRALAHLGPRVLLVIDVARVIGEEPFDVG